MNYVDLTKAQKRLFKGRRALTMSDTLDPNRESYNADVLTTSTQTEIIVLQPNQDQTVAVEKNSAVVAHNENVTTSNIEELSSNTVTNTHSANQTKEHSVPFWAAKMNDCQVIGNSYCGWVSSMDQLELLLTYHRQGTKSSWGVRQTTSSGRSSFRLMWKSQYAPFDGIPFVNTGSRAITMECKHGPRRKGNGLKRPANSKESGFKLACPARIYIKQVKKFPQYSLHLFGDKKNTKEAMDRAFFSLKMDGIEGKGEDRWYVQLPTSEAHEFHDSNIPRRGRQRKIEVPNIEWEKASQASDTLETSPKKQMKLMHPRLVEKLREMVASGQKNIVPIRKALRIFVEKELFPNEQIPNRHNPYYFPTVNDVQNFVHEELKDLESRSIPHQCSTATNETLESVSSTETQIVKDNSETDVANTSVNSELKSITLTLSQNENPELAPVISRIETHLSDGTTQITSEINDETLQMLKKLQPLLFSQDINENHEESSSNGQELEFQYQSLPNDTNRNEELLACVPNTTQREALSTEDMSSRELNVDIFLEN